MTDRNLELRQKEKAPATTLPKNDKSSSGTGQKHKLYRNKQKSYF